MENEIEKKPDGRGGARAGAGRKKGGKNSKPRKDQKYGPRSKEIWVRMFEEEFNRFERLRGELGRAEYIRKLIARDYRIRISRTGDSGDVGYLSRPPLPVYKMTPDAERERKIKSLERIAKTLENLKERIDADEQKDR